jgi:hypothetical protein
VNENVLFQEPLAEHLHRRRSVTAQRHAEKPSVDAELGDIGLALRSADAQAEAGRLSYQ